MNSVLSSYQMKLGLGFSNRFLRRLFLSFKTRCNGTAKCIFLILQKLEVHLQVKNKNEYNRSGVRNPMLPKVSLTHNTDTKFAPEQDKTYANSRRNQLLLRSLDPISVICSCHAQDVDKARWLAKYVQAMR